MKETGRVVNRDLIVRGSLITLRRRCGKPTCRCANHQPHATPALSYSIGGSTKMLTLRPQDLALVKAALARYRKARAELDKRALRGLRAVRAHIAHEKAGGRGQSR
jgi:hypothetical protein